MLVFQQPIPPLLDINRCAADYELACGDLVFLSMTSLSIFLPLVLK